ncbi:unnamed protein product [Closterium sp. Naga37s-1]|nr:unnamed protein product [Closterium sp. Naga37s-1]
MARSMDRAAAPLNCTEGEGGEGVERAAKGGGLSEAHGEATARPSSSSLPWQWSMARSMDRAAAPLNCTEDEEKRGEGGVGRRGVQEDDARTSSSSLSRQWPMARSTARAAAPLKCTVGAVQAERQDDEWEGERGVERGDHTSSSSLLLQCSSRSRKLLCKFLSGEDDVMQGPQLGSRHCSDAAASAVSEFAVSEFAVRPPAPGSGVWNASGIWRKEGSRGDRDKGAGGELRGAEGIGGGSGGGSRGDFGKQGGLRGAEGN